MTWSQSWLDGLDTVEWSKFLDTPVRSVFLTATLYPKWTEIDVSFLPHHKGPITSTCTRMDEDDLGKVTGPKENAGVSERLSSTHPEATSV
jgi:hypothetical protein